MSELYFESQYGDRRVIANCDNREQVYHEIDKFIKECNVVNARAGRPQFKSHYIRTWESDGEIHFDVGSHSEFFHWRHT